MASRVAAALRSGGPSGRTHDDPPGSRQLRTVVSMAAATGHNSGVDAAGGCKLGVRPRASLGGTTMLVAPASAGRPDLMPPPKSALKGGPGNVAAGPSCSRLGTFSGALPTATVGGGRTTGSGGQSYYHTGPQHRHHHHQARHGADDADALDDEYCCDLGEEERGGGGGVGPDPIAMHDVQTRQTRNVQEQSSHHSTQHHEVGGGWWGASQGWAM